MTLFKDEQFESAAGISLPFKIDCDALSDEDLACIVKNASQSIVYGFTQTSAFAAAYGRGTDEEVRS